MFPEEKNIAVDSPTTPNLNLRETGQSSTVSLVHESSETSQSPTPNLRETGQSSTVSLVHESSETSQSQSVVAVSTEPDQNSTNTQLSASKNPIIQLLRDQQLGKTVLTYVVPMITGVLVFYAKEPSSSTLQFTSSVVSLSVGLTALWNGIVLRNTFPDAVANAVELFGAAAVFFAFFSVVTSLLPPNLDWLPWTCFVLILLPSILACIPFPHPSSTELAN